jgi:hypothetical protein
MDTNLNNDILSVIYGFLHSDVLARFAHLLLDFKIACIVDSHCQPFCTFAFFNGAGLETGPARFSQVLGTYFFLNPP